MFFNFRDFSFLKMFKTKLSIKSFLIFLLLSLLQVWLLFKALFFLYNILKLLCDAHFILTVKRKCFHHGSTFKICFPYLKCFTPFSLKIFLEVFVFFSGRSTRFVELNIFFLCKIADIFYLLFPDMARKWSVKYCWIWTLNDFWDIIL